MAGLLALMLLTEARRPARVSASGELVALDEQDRGAWDSAQIAEGHRLVRERLSPGRARSLSDPRRDQCRAHFRPRRPGHRLVAGRRPLRPARAPRSLADRRPEPGARGRRAHGPDAALASVDRLEDKAGRLPRLSTRRALSCFADLGVVVDGIPYLAPELARLYATREHTLRR